MKYFRVVQHKHFKGFEYSKLGVTDHKNVWLHSEKLLLW